MIITGCVMIAVQILRVLAHLGAENDYTNSTVKTYRTDARADFSRNQRPALKKMIIQCQPKRGDYFYFTSQMQGENEYPIYVRASDFSR